MSHKKSPVLRMGMAEARLKLPELAASLASDPDRIVEVTRRGRPVLHLVAPPRIPARSNAARRIMQRVAQLEMHGPSPTRSVAGRYRELLYGRARRV